MNDQDPVIDGVEQEEGEGTEEQYSPEVERGSRLSPGEQGEEEEREGEKEPFRPAGRDALGIYRAYLHRVSDHSEKWARNGRAWRRLTASR